MDRAARILTSAGFIAGLILLLANDFVLKQTYPSVLTGKLSDFAGLFIFPMFFAAFWPRRAREIFIATAIMFVWWKSPWSQGAIDAWNAAGPYEIGRVVDYTDLAALVVLPLSFAYVISRRRAGTQLRSVRRWSMPAVLALASFAFAATSQARDLYEYSGDDRAVFALERTGISFTELMDASGLWHKGVDDLSVLIEVDLDRCEDARFEPESKSSGEIEVRLVSVTNGCGEGDGPDNERQHFQEEVVDRLNGDRPPFDRRHGFDGNRTAHDARFVLDASLPATAQALDRLGLLHRVREGHYELRLERCAFIFELVPDASGGTAALLSDSYDGCAKDAPPEVMAATFRLSVLAKLGTISE